MATTRFSLIQWADDTAAVERSQFNNAFSAIDNLGAGYTQTTGAPAAASADKVGFVHFNTTDDTLFYCDGSAWFQITVTGNTTDGTISAITPGDASAAGSSSELAKADHVHEMSAFGAITTLSASATSTDGSAATFSRSDHVHGIPNSTITNDMLAGSISGSKLTSGTITATQIDASAVGTSEIAADAVTTAKIAAGAVDTTELAADAVTGAKIADNALNSEHYTDRSIDAIHIATGAITANELATNSVGASEIAANAVGASEIAANAVGASEIASGAVTSTKINSSVAAAANAYGFEGSLTGGKNIQASTGSGQPSNSTGSNGDIVLYY
jgi:hypothetical protein